jgi:hypothetical protein
MFIFGLFAEINLNSLLRFFRYNDPYRLLAVLVIMCLLSTPFFIWPVAITVQQLKQFLVGEAVSDGKSMYVQVFDQTPLLYAWILGILDFVFGRSAGAFKVIALLILFFQASYFSMVLIRNKVYAENNYLSALIFAVIAFFSFDVIWVSPELLGAGFLLLAIDNLFKEVEFKTQRDEIILNLGLWIGLASLIIFSYTVFLFGAFIVLIIFTRLTLRRGLLLGFGFLLPHGLIIISYFFLCHLNFLISNFYVPNLTSGSHTLISMWMVVKLASVVIVYLLFSWFVVNREARFTKYQSQILQVMFLWLLIALIEIIFTRERTPHSFLTLLPSLSYFISHYLLLIKRKWLGEMMLWIFVVSVPLVGVLAARGYFESIDYTGFRIPESKFAIRFKSQRILVLTDDLSAFLNNRSASYFLDWNLSKEVFNHPEYFENVIWIADSFEKDLPEIIIDPEDKMSKFFDRLPTYKELYKRDGEVYKLISN